jgi:hypothetical protein
MRSWDNLAQEFWCVSLKTDTQRRKEVINEFKRVGLDDVKFSLQTKDISDTKRGCFNAHMGITLDAIKRGVKSVCIFEDDVRFENTFRVKRALLELNGWSNYDILFLGHAPLRPLYKVRPGIVKGSKFALTHAYVLSSKGMENVSKIRYSGKHYDMTLSNIENKCAIFPMIVFQDDCPSSNDSKFGYWVLTKIRNTLGCRNLCRWSEIFGYVAGNCHSFLRRYTSRNGNTEKKSDKEKIEEKDSKEEDSKEEDSEEKELLPDKMEHYESN